MASSTVENYIKTIYQLEGEQELVPMGRLAAGMQVTPGTATTMVKTLNDSGLIEYQPRLGVRLTRGGRKLALHVLRRHRLIELLLVEVIGLDWSEVHDEAEQLEHAVSDRLMDRIDQLLGYPERDPHGDPIPTANGEIDSTGRRSLADCEAKTGARITRIMDQDPAFLQYLHGKGLVPGADFEVVERSRGADAITVRTSEARLVTLGSSAARKIRVED